MMRCVLASGSRTIGGNLSAAIDLRRVDCLTGSILAELGATRGEVAAKPAGGAMLDVCVREMTHRFRKLAGMRTQVAAPGCNRCES